MWAFVDKMLKSSHFIFNNNTAQILSRKTENVEKSTISVYKILVNRLKFNMLRGGNYAKFSY